MFLFEWIEHYINTPEWQRTLADEALFLTAISIILIKKDTRIEDIDKSR